MSCQTVLPQHTELRRRRCMYDRYIRHGMRLGLKVPMLVSVSLCDICVCELSRRIGRHSRDDLRTDGANV